MSQESGRSSFDATQSAAPSPSPVNQSTTLKRHNADMDDYLNKRAKHTPEEQRPCMPDVFTFSEEHLEQLGQFDSLPDFCSSPIASQASEDDPNISTLGAETVFVPPDDQPTS